MKKSTVLSVINIVKNRMGINIPIRAFEIILQIPALAKNQRELTLLLDRVVFFDKVVSDNPTFVALKAEQKTVMLYAIMLFSLQDNVPVFKDENNTQYWGDYFNLVSPDIRKKVLRVFEGHAINFPHLTEEETFLASLLKVIVVGNLNFEETLEATIDDVLFINLPQAGTQNHVVFIDTITFLAYDTIQALYGKDGSVWETLPSMGEGNHGEPYHQFFIDELNGIKGGVLLKFIRQYITEKITLVG